MIRIRELKSNNDDVQYWVRTEDISRVKHTVLQNLPIFQHDLESLAGDSQLTNSVYFDNSQVSFYRLHCFFGGQKKGA